ncbi:MAG: fumarylacetoacetate hydrolase family protein [Dehalococcoidia bacterium]
MTLFARYSFHGEINYGILEGSEIQTISSAPYNEYKLTGETKKLDEVKLLTPTKPSKVVAIGLNYKSHLGSKTPPSVPEPFLKIPTSIIGPEDNIIIPKVALEENVTVQPEAEMAVVIGKTCKKATQANATDYILGYTCGNDVSARDWQSNDLQWWRAKSSDTFTPIGPVINTELEHNNMHLIGRVNGKVTQDQVTSDLLHDVPKIIEFVSSVMTLLPGDVIMTGTPGTPPNIHPGDETEVEIEGIGILKNSVIAGE